MGTWTTPNWVILSSYTKFIWICMKCSASWSTFHHMFKAKRSEYVGHTHTWWSCMDKNKHILYELTLYINSLDWFLVSIFRVLTQTYTHTFIPITCVYLSEFCLGIFLQTRYMNLIVLSYSSYSDERCIGNRLCNNWNNFVLYTNGKRYRRDIQLAVSGLMNHILCKFLNTVVF